ncbi:hypothetical protein LTR84_005236 [Exophiala bonariae]|uniref:Ig-like domain-containing protein n=1 Tax=Exophiala bonariae TaxID=1690606 RepID=A0AAV9NPL3_9EURO|nr:hypothetical protein LTR84_005236 [Exophiala bonariae]
MAPSWVSLPQRWQLQNIQAALNVIVCAISALTTFCCIRFCWWAGTKRVKTAGRTTLTSLLTVNTIGEAYDLITLLGLRIFSPRHALLLVQSLLVLVFVTTTLISGPISRFSTRMHPQTTTRNTSIFPTMKTFDIIAYANDYWTNITRSLETAEFPRDRLLDFLPDTNTEWMFVPSEWTKTWSMQCNSVERTPIEIAGTGNCSDPSFSTTYQAFPQLWDVINITSYDTYGIEWSGFWLSNVNPVQDMLWFAYASSITDIDNTTDIVYGMNISMATVHFHNIYQNLTKPNNCIYAARPVDAASWIRTDCQLERQRDVKDEGFVPYPDSTEQSNIASALNQNFQARFMMEAGTNRTITEIQPDDLIRFYQVYMISKDTQFRQPVMRSLTIVEDVPQLSVALLTIMLFLVITSILAASTWCSFFLIHHDASRVPQTKLDWVLHALGDDENNAAGNTKSSPQQSPRSSIDYQSIASSTRKSQVPPLPRRATRLADFESATYAMEFSERRAWTESLKGRSWMPSPRSLHSSAGSSSRLNRVSSRRDSTWSKLSDEAPSITLDMPRISEELYPRRLWPE